MANLIRLVWTLKDGLSGHGDWFEDSPQRRKILNAWMAEAQENAPGIYRIESQAAAQVAKELSYEPVDKDKIRGGFTANSKRYS